MTTPEVGEAADLDPYAGDPFFKRHTDPTWNACIGEQGDEENYLDGYIDAALQLSRLVIEQKLFAKRDTLVLPILYTARHALELALKFSTGHLEKAELLQKPAGRPSHNIREYWERLDRAAIGDEVISRKLSELKPFIDSLSRIDRDGQELRYHLNQFSDPSLSSYSLANLEIIQASLVELSEIIEVLKNRIVSFVDERHSGLFTNRCSRRDLVTIAQLMPRRESWSTSLFDTQKAVVIKRFNLSNRQFCEALNVIQTARETKAILGMETKLLHLTDDEILWIVEQWRRIHPKAQQGEAALPSFIDRAWIKQMKEKQKVRSEVISTVQEKISGAKLAEIEAIFYLGRDGVYPEDYEPFIEKKQEEHAAANDAQSEIVHLMTKTNFLHSVTIATRKLGRLSLTTKLALM
ncbi:hypothetical protein [Bradyrhizobium sp. CB2312]|uniref:hypothetical protein n=1 Tax=Bradyrhizobium sp. CB2312 TaxID=3039155 RepID=UPI0024B11467|nr:hypothetical protein [Bradyrhizobium sp. CB2312]WFU73094.1 hypothetical protein QA642_03165 [Bradyrhizobium sp. CB2312]